MPTKTITQGMVLNAFIDKMLAATGQENTNPEEQRAVREGLRLQLESEMEKAMIKALPDAKLIELNKMLERENVSDDEIEKFFETSGVDFQKVIEGVMQKFAEDYRNNNAGNAGGQV